MISKQLNKPHIRCGVILIILVFAAMAFFPIFWMLMTSLKGRVDFLAIPPKWLFFPTFKNYKEILSSADFIQSYGNSIIISACSVCIGIVVGVPCAYGLSRFHFKGKTTLGVWILSTRFAPPVATLLPFYMMFSSLKLIDTYTGLILVYMVINLPLIIWLMYGFFKDVPFELEEAALLDGSTPFQAFLRVILPLVMPGMVSTLILSLIFCWNELMFSLILSSTQTRTLPVAIYSFVSYQEIAWGSMSAAGMLAILPVAIFTMMIQKHLVTGLTFGAIKQ